MNPIESLLASFKDSSRFVAASGSISLHFLNCVKQSYRSKGGINKWRGKKRAYLNVFEL